MTKAEWKHQLQMLSHCKPVVKTLCNQCHFIIYANSLKKTLKLHHYTPNHCHKNLKKMPLTKSSLHRTAAITNSLDCPFKPVCVYRKTSNTESKTGLGASFSHVRKVMHPCKSPAFRHGGKNVELSLNCTSLKSCYEPIHTDAGMTGWLSG